MKHYSANRDIYRRATKSISRHKTRPFENGAGKALEALCLKFLSSSMATQLGLPQDPLWLVSPNPSPDPLP